MTKQKTIGTLTRIKDGSFTWEPDFKNKTSPIIQWITNQSTYQFEGMVVRWGNQEYDGTIFNKK